jgi:hypothetical protein
MTTDGKTKVQKAAALLRQSIDELGHMSDQDTTDFGQAKAIENAKCCFPTWREISKLANWMDHYAIGELSA